MPYASKLDLIDVADMGSAFARCFCTSRASPSCTAVPFMLREGEHYVKSDLLPAVRLFSLLVELTMCWCGCLPMSSVVPLPCIAAALLHSWALTVLSPFRHLWLYLSCMRLMSSFTFVP